jgi:flagellar P-ring protein precursor FlgI
VTVNVPSAGRIPNGAIVERGVPSPFGHGAGDGHEPELAGLHHRAARRRSINEAWVRVRRSRWMRVSIEVLAPQDPGLEGGLCVVLENLESIPRRRRRRWSSTRATARS